MHRTELRNRVFYSLRPLIPRRAQVWLRSRMARRKRRAHSAVWPILEAAGRTPEGGFAWPDGRRFAFVILHDVESAIGQDRCLELMRLEHARGFCSAFNFVPERYPLKPDVRQTLAANGFEIGVHGLEHSGKLFRSRAIFLERARKINSYLKAWGASGFVSPSSLHHLPWMHDLAIEWDSSTFDSDPFEPQPDGMTTIFPFWYHRPHDVEQGFVELPYTLAQDFTLFVLLGERGIDVWKRKLDWIAARGGMALVIAHPDYMCFGGGRPGFQEYPVARYLELLDYVSTTYQGQYWHTLPKQVAAHVRAGSPGINPRVTETKPAEAG